MATTDLSAYGPGTVPDAGKMRIGIVVADWNGDITQTLRRTGISSSFMFPEPLN
jgi:6,7-dimethyl-8-ribityllumazine synthase